MPRRIDPEVRRKFDETVLRRYAEGMPIRQIAAEVGRNQWQVQEALERHPEFYAQHRRRGRIELIAEEVEALIKAGNTYGTIAAITGCSHSTVWRFAKANGMDWKARKPADPKQPRVKPITLVTPEQCETIVEMAGRAETYRAIIEATGLGEHTINLVLKREGLWPKPKRILRSEDFDPPWWPEPGSPTYPDDFVLKPADRARLEYVRYRRNIGRPILARQYKKNRRQK